MSADKCHRKLNAKRCKEWKTLKLAKIELWNDGGVDVGYVVRLIKGILEFLMLFCYLPVSRYTCTGNYVQSKRCHFRAGIQY